MNEPIIREKPISEPKLVADVQYKACMEVDGYGSRGRIDDIFDHSAYAWNIRTELSQKFEKSKLFLKLKEFGLTLERQQALLKEAVIQEITATSKIDKVKTITPIESVVATYEYQGVLFEVTANVKENTIEILDAQIL